ncbi:MAG: FtsW/RodA/SpoVE family cell cycle protein [Evtepia gabavorous]
MVRARSRARDTSRGPRPRAPPRRPCPPGTRISFFPWRGGAGPGGLLLRSRALLGAILFRCVWLAHRSRDPLFAAVAMGVAGVFGAQTILNIGMCLYVAPVVGVTLPFFSYGGSSLLTAFGGVGIVMSMKQEKLGGSGNWPGA